jgi:hypothetical protein
VRGESFYVAGPGRDSTLSVSQRESMRMRSSFSSIPRYCADLEQAGALTPRAKHRFQAFTVEVQGELNLEILEHMDRIEMEDWARGGRVREKWEKYLRDESSRKKPTKSQKSSPQTRAGSDASIRHA